MKTEQQNVNERRHEHFGARTAFAKVAFGNQSKVVFLLGVRDDNLLISIAQIKANRASSDGDTPAVLSNQHYSI
ncbi:hypothetical protein, partial [Planococcus sp. S3-L1]|uniref:hypothetical protein n=1 Tax=Planococcus sp. S3-L1 TaxID=3046200 RepID=UPI0024B9B8C0